MPNFQTGDLCGLGTKYVKGEGVTQDSAEAAKWYRKAAEQRVAPAQYVLGFMYTSNGLRCPTGCYRSSQMV